MKGFTMKSKIGLIFIYLAVFYPVSSVFPGVQENGHTYKNQAQAILKNILTTKDINNVAKNVILIVGDGMSLATVAAARVLKGQKAGRSGVGEEMLYETFPNVGLARTYATDKYVPDSASTATAFLCGAKTKYEAVAVSDSVLHGNCSSVRETELKCIAEWALAKEKSVGLVTNMRVTHATPAPLYAHAPDRWWELDAKVPLKDRTLCKDIAKQLVEDYPGRDIQVILGGGREVFMPKTTYDPEYPEKKGKREDNIKLIEVWKNHKLKNKLSHRYVWNKKEFDKVDPAKVDYLLGLFEPGHMYDVTERDQAKVSDFKEPTLAEMTEKAIRILSKNQKGYFLLVEGGLIDKRHHSGRAVRAVSEALDMERSVEVALNLTSREDTLLLVTSDHSQGLIFSGYAKVGDDIFGIAEVSNVDKMPYTTLLYSTGPGYSVDPKTGRKNITGINTADKDYLQQAVLPRSTATHGGEDVAVYATGPMAHLFTGVYDQHYVAHAMAYAACIGANLGLCEPQFAGDAAVGLEVQSIAVHLVLSVVLLTSSWIVM